jgi:alanine racemase
LLVIGYVSAENIAHSKVGDIAFTITSLDQLTRLCEITSKPLKLHVKVDTGMHRQGIMPDEVNDCVAMLKSNQNLTLEGVCTHLSDADGDKKDYSLKQIKVWEKVVKEFSDDFKNVEYFHLAASAGSYFSSGATNNVARLGLGLYGISTSPHIKLKLRHALEMKSVISSTREVNSGDEIGYSRTFKAPTKMKIATVPVGYFEGVDRRLSNKGVFMVGEQECPIVGRVSMNITSIDVSNVEGIKLGDEVTVISSDPKNQNSVTNIALKTDTIPYEVLVKIPQHLRRIII